MASNPGNLAGPGRRYEAKRGRALVGCTGERRAGVSRCQASCEGPGTLPVPHSQHALEVLTYRGATGQDQGVAGAAVVNYLRLEHVGSAVL